jgi:phosphohistidine phosphatase SixA
MKQACDRKLSELNDFFDQKPPEGPERSAKYHLYNVAETFSQAQYKRNEADYNLVSEWQPTEVSLLLETIADAVKSWAVIRHEPLARDFLISMLPSRERKQNERTRPKSRPTATDKPKS